MEYHDSLVGRSLVFVFSGLLAFGCKTGAVAVDECRELQELRCEGALFCGIGEIRTRDDVAECKRFYRDECLHGIENTTPPSKAEHEVCVSMVQSAITCATEDVLDYLEDGEWLEDPETPVEYTLAKDCEGVDPTRDPNGPVLIEPPASINPANPSVCGVVRSPASFYDCGYVNLPSDENNGAAGANN
ncbi:MAG: hypothetical protein MK135_07750 [Polyangiaceae bacterium]|nr:hypothetical protein [Polyangiaceae bacterium]